jgi:hypothetical protein
MLHVSTHKGSYSGVSSYTLLITELQREILIFLFAYTGHEIATFVFIYILFQDIDSSGTKLLNLTIMLKLILILELI